MVAHMAIVFGYDGSATAYTITSLYISGRLLYRRLPPYCRDRRRRVLTTTADLTHPHLER